jgi:hypothetical protein
MDELVTIPKSEYDKLRTQSKKYTAYTKCVQRLQNDRWQNEDGESGSVDEIEDVQCKYDCPASSIGIPILAQVYYFNCKFMRRCFGCRKHLCNRHNYYWIENKIPDNADGFPRHGRVGCCDGCIFYFPAPKYETVLDTDSF